MADDIDIEEHDVMENPMIKQIFPDLSILKKEILDYDDDIQHELKSFYTSENKLYRNINKNKLTGKFSKTRRTKPKNNISPKKIKMQLISEVRIYLKNIRPELLRSKKFCKICLILFSKTDSFSDHQLSYHYDIDDGKDTSHKQYNSKSSIEKRKECQVYMNTDNVGKHESNTNFVRNMSETKLEKSSRINEVDVMVELNDPKDKSNDSNFAKACFHCSVVFPSRQSLIDHLYEILNNKNSKSQITQHTSERDIIQKNYEILQSAKDQQKVNKGGDLQTSNLYCCPICSYYFNVKKFYVGHLLIKHKLSKKVPIKSVDFSSKCKFCDLNYNDVLSYNTHLRKSHRNEMIKKYNNELFFIKNKDFQKSTNRKPKSINKSSQNIIDKLLMNGVNEVCILASKVILFKCINCEIHFLTPDSAKNHSECVVSNNWKCLKCQNTFKRNDKNLHKKQHSYSNYFSVVEVNGDGQDEMYRCHKSDEDIKKDNCTNHLPSSESQTSIQLGKYIMHYYFCSACKSYLPIHGNVEIHRKLNCVNIKKYVCEFCGLMFSGRLLTVHRKLHLKYNSKLQDFTFYNLSSKQILPIKPSFPKCISCEIHFVYKHEVDSHVCEKSIYSTCPDCKMKFSDSAYTLHEQFHRYELKETDINLVFKLPEVMEDGPKHDCGDKIQYLFTCKNCDVSMNVYDEVVEHCHSHANLNKIDLKLDEVKCKICNVNFVRSSFKQHQSLHLIHTKHQLKYLSFDVLHFNSNNDEWLAHLFGSFDKNAINKIIENSIYKYENRVRMEIIQLGTNAFTFFKCDKCKCYVNSSSIYKHVESCSIGSDKFYCKTCNIPFANVNSKIDHEKDHADFRFDLSSTTIVTFNRKEDKVYNKNISRIKYYVLYQCRYCHEALEGKPNFISHKCYSHKCKNCNICGLLISEKDYVRHLYKHKVLNSFNRKVMKVVLIGNKVLNKDETRANSHMSKFTGMVCDYTFYKCVNCDVCIRDQRSTLRHYCLIDAAKSKCPRCGLSFDEGKIKGHLKLHDTDPDLTKDTILVKEFGCNKPIIEELCVSANVKTEPNDFANEIVSPNAVVERTNEINDSIPSSDLVFKIYKCFCGLHFTNELEISEHIKKCSGFVKTKQSRQDCFKCGLTFTQSVLFKHLLEHHGGKKTFKYEIIECSNNFVPVF